MTDDREALRERLAEAAYTALGWSGCDGSRWERVPAEFRRKWYEIADALLPVVVAEKAAAWDECLERVTSGVRSAMEAHRERGHRQIVAALSGLSGAVPQTDNPYRAALADDREGGEQ